MKLNKSFKNCLLYEFTEKGYLDRLLKNSSQNTKIKGYKVLVLIPFVKYEFIFISCYVYNIFFDFILFIS